MKTLILLAGLSVSGCQCGITINNKTEAQCQTEQQAHMSCLFHLEADFKKDNIKALKEMCATKKEVYPCKLDNSDVDYYMDDKCPLVVGCNGN